MEITLWNYNRQAISYICMWAIGYFLWILWNNAIIIFGKNCIVFIAPYTVLVICNILWTIGIKCWSLNKKSSVCILITGICNIFDRGSILPNAYSYHFTMLVPSMSAMFKAGIYCMRSYKILCLTWEMWKLFHIKLLLWPFLIWPFPFDKIFSHGHSDSRESVFTAVI